MKQSVCARRRVIILILSFVLLALTAIGGTLAWIASDSSQMTNTFVPGNVPCEVWEGTPLKNESGKDVPLGSVKENVTIKNVGNIDSYIRVALVPVWRNEDGTGTGLNADIGVLSTLGAGWSYEDGYYYYAYPVAPQTLTATPLFTSFTAPEVPGGAPDGTYFELQVLAQSIQADGMGATDAVDAFEKALAATQTNPLP